MLTVTLRSDAASLLLCTVDGPEHIAFDTVADMAGRAPVTTTGEFRDRLTGALVAASLKVNAYGGLDAGAATIDFDRITVGDGDVLTDFPLTAFHEFTREGALKAWETRDRGKGGRRDSEEGFVEGPGVGPRTTAQAEAERDRVAKLLKDAKDPGPARARILADLDDNGDGSTIAEHDRINGDQWTAERRALHTRIINGRLAAANNVPREGKAVLVGGLPGSGKSKVLEHDDVRIDRDKYLVLDPDEIKQELIDLDGIKQVGEMSDGEHAAWLHQESTHIIHRLRDKATHRGINVIIDKTMSKSPRDDLEKLRKKGYAVHGVFVDVSIDESLASVDSRWKDGGRFIPPPYIESSRIEGANSKNVLAFQSASDLFDDWTYVTNDGIAIRKPNTKVRKGSGRFEFAMDGMAVFRGNIDAVPRDWHGRWTGPGGNAARDARTEGDIVVDQDGGTVRVSPSAAVDLVTDLGTRPTPSDLTKVHIDGHPGLFGRVGRNTLRRVDMPQVPTDRLDVFADYLAARGIKVTHEFVSPLELKATQNELDGRKVGQMITAMQHGTMSTDDKPLWASADGYILDGHHRWAAEAVLAASGADRAPMFIIRVGVPMTQLIGQARAFNQIEGIDSKKHGMTLQPVVFTRDGAIKAWQTRDRGNTGGTLVDAETSSGRRVLRAGDSADRTVAERQSGLDHNEERPDGDAKELDSSEAEWGQRTLTVKVYETGDRFLVRADAYKTGNHAPEGTVDPADPGWEMVDVNVWGHGRTFTDRPEAMKFRRNLEGVANGQRAVPKFALAFTREGALKAWETRDRGKGGDSTDAGNGLPGADEFDQMEKTGGPLGSQGGGWYRDDNGQRYLVKPAKSRRHAMNELASALLYKHAGTPVDETGIFERDGKWFIAKQAIQGPDGKLGKIVGDDITPDLQRQAQDGFATDALASSWDAYGLVGDNVIVEGGTLHRIDVGGSGMYRAMGGDKPSFNPGKEWVEPTTLRTSNQGRKLYGDLSDDAAADQLAKLKSFDIDGFDRKLAATGVDDDVRKRTVDTVRDRIERQLDGIIAGLDPKHPLVASVAFLDPTTFTREWATKAWESAQDIGELGFDFTREGAIKAWESRDRGGDDVDMSGLTMEAFGKLTPSKRSTTPAEWLASPDEIADAQALVESKARNVPKPTRAEIAKNRAMLKRAKTSGRAGGELRGNSTVRRERAEALLAEFDPAGKGYCPCGSCGIKVSPKGRGGYASMQQDKILTASEGGKYGTKNSFPNLIPSCGGCNSTRNDEPYHIRPDWESALAASAGSVSEFAVTEGEVIAFPLGWDDPEADTLDTPVQGVMSSRTVETPWGTYDQWLVGGEVVDPSTVTDLSGKALTA